MMRLLQLLSSLIVTTLFVPLGAYARDFSYTYQSQTLTYTVIDETAKICMTKAGYEDSNNKIHPGNNVSGDLIIPAIANDGNADYSVTSIGSEAFSGCSGLTSVTIPNSVTTIGGYAFFGCSGLTSVTIPNSVTEIRQAAFRNCPSLTSVTIGNSVTSMGQWTFSGCSGLTSVTIGNSVTTIGAGAFHGCSGLTSVTIPNSVTSIGESAFDNCSGLTSVTIPNSVTSIGKEAFWGCSSLTSVTIGNSVTSIGESAFYDCSGLTSVTIPNSVTSIGISAFRYCSGLTSVTIGNSVTSIGESAFDNCSGLTSVHISDLEAWCKIDFYDDANPLRYAHHLYLNGSEITNLTIPSSITGISRYAFYGCSGLTSVTIPNSVTSIGDYAFGNCSGLTSIDVDSGNPNFVSYDGALYDKSLKTLRLCPAGKTSITFPSSMTSIGIRAFYSCRVLTSVTIPNSVTSIGWGAFLYCSGLTSLTIPNSVTEIGGSAFYSCSGLTSLTIPNSVTEIGYDAFVGCSGLTEIVIGTLDASVTPKLYLRKELFTTYNIKKLTIGNVVSGIENSAFRNSNFRNIEKVEIADMALWTQNNNVSSFASTDTLWVLAPLQNGVLKNFSKLKSLTIPCTSGTVDTPGNIGELFGTESFADTRAMTQYFEDGTSKTYYIPTSLEELTISEGCGILPYGALSNCNMLKKVTLPASLYMVGEKAMYGCAGVTDVYCQSADPAVAYSNSFDGMRLSSCKLHVPYNSVDLYKAAEGWKRFSYIQDEASISIQAIPNILNAGVILGLQEYRAGDTAELRAIANSGYTFDGWYENGTLLTTADTYTFAVTGSRSLSVIFTPISGSGPVTLTPGGATVTMTWPPVEGAASYGATLYSDAAMQNPVATVNLDGNGAVSTRSQAPASLSATFDNLEAATDYYYSISAFNAQMMTLSRYDGTFTTGVAAVADILDGAAAVAGYYNLNGEWNTTPWSGVNIVVYTDGTTGKMIRR